MSGDRIKRMEVYLLKEIAYHIINLGKGSSKFSESMNHIKIVVVNCDATHGLTH